MFSASPSNEETDLLPQCLQGYRKSSGSVNDLPDISADLSAGDVYVGNVVDIV